MMLQPDVAWIISNGSGIDAAVARSRLDGAADQTDRQERLSRTVSDGNR